MAYNENPSYLQLAGGTMTGNLILNADPSTALGASTKQYVDNAIAAVNPATSVVAATTANLNATYLNGVSGIGATLTNAGALAAFTIDGQTPTLGQRVLVKNQSSTFQNGIYIVSTLGTGVIAWILTRALDYDQPSNINNTGVINVVNGTVNALTGWLLNSTVTTVGTDAITYIQYNTAPISVTQYDVLVGGASNAIVSVGPGSSGQVLQSGGNSANPAYSTATYPATATGTGTLLRASGTNWSATTSTYPNTNAVNTLLYASSVNVMAALATANNGTLVTDGSGIPSISSTLPSAVQGNITSTGTITSGTWNGTSIDATHGGTAQTSWATGDILYASGVNTLAKLTAGSNTQVLTLAGGVPTWASPTTGTVTSVSGTTNRITSTGGATPVIDISASYVGQSSITTLGTVTTGTWNASVIPLAYGGTNANLTASNGGIFYSTASTAAILSGTATANKVLMSGASTTPVWSTPTFPNASASSGKIIQSDGTNWIASTPTYPSSSGGSGKIIYDNGTNFVESTPTFPASASATTRKIIVSDGTNWTASTETWAVPGTSGNLLTSDGTNWTSAAASAGSTSIVVCNTPGTDSPVASTTYYLRYGGLITTSTSATSAWAKIYMPRSGTIKACYGAVVTNGTLSSAQNASLNIRLNDTTDTLVSNSVSFQSASTTFNNSSLSISVSAGDFITFKLVTPAWGTSPTSAGLSIAISIS